MRRIDSLKDAEDAMREVWSRLDNLSSQNLDMQKRRVVNATPSRDEYDCVVRKELKATEVAVQQQIQRVVAQSTGLKKYTVVFAHGGFPAAEEYASPYFIVQKPGTITKVKAVCYSPPVGVDAIFNVWHYGLPLLITDAHIAAGSIASVVHEFTNLDPSLVQTYENNLLAINLSQTGKIGKFTVEVWIDEA